MTKDADFGGAAGGMVPMAAKEYPGARERAGINNMAEARRTIGGGGAAAVAGSPGVRPRFAGFIRGLLPLLVFLFLAGYFLRAAFPEPAMPRTMAGLILVALCTGLAVAMYAGERRTAAYFKGALGEEEVARALHRLPSGYTVFHGLLPRGAKTDLDHVVVGPTGIFVVETKNWAGAITVNGQEVLYNGQRPDRAPLEQVKEAAGCLHRALTNGVSQAWSVRAVICFAGGNLPSGVQGVAGVMLCGPNDLPGLLAEGGGDVLGAAEVNELVEVLKQMDRRGA